MNSTVDTQCDWLVGRWTFLQRRAWLHSTVNKNTIKQVNALLKNWNWLYWF